MIRCWTTQQRYNIYSPFFSLRYRPYNLPPDSVIPDVVTYVDGSSWNLNYLNVYTLGSYYVIILQTMKIYGYYLYQIGSYCEPSIGRFIHCKGQGQSHAYYYC